MIKLDVRRPLKRKKKITRRDNSEFVVSCKYERLGDFCFSCGLVTHTERFCRRSIDRRGEPGTREWGNWLKAPPRMVAGGVKSKWLREEDDDSWELRIGRENRKAGFQENQNSNFETVGKERRDIRDEIATKSVKTNLMVPHITNNEIVGFKASQNPLYGPEEDELDGLQLEERKRKRIGPDSLSTMDVDGNNILSGPNNTHNITGAVISDSDLATPSSSLSAKLAKQASRSS